MYDLGGYKFDDAESSQHPVGCDALRSFCEAEYVPFRNQPKKTNRLPAGHLHQAQEPLDPFIHST